MSSEAQRQIKAECREWLTLLHSGEVSDADLERFNAWLQADPQHQRAYEDLQVVWGDIAKLHHLAELEPVPLRAPPERSAVTLRVARRTLPWAAAAAAVGFAVIVLESESPTSSTPVLAAAEFSRDYATQLGEVRAIELPDGSTLTLGARSHAVVTMTRAERRVKLERGEAYFDVANNPARPFYVDAQSAAVRVVGTRFDVRLGHSHVRIAVDEGAVAVNSHPAAVSGGQRIDVLPNGNMTEATGIDANEVAAWRQGRLIYQDAALSEVVADLSRYRPNVTISSPDAGKLRITAGLRVEQIDQFVDRLPDILPVRVTRTDTSIVIDAG